MARPKDPNSMAGQIRALLSTYPNNADIVAKPGCKPGRVSAIRREAAKVAKAAAAASIEKAAPKTKPKKAA